ncbi:hypothetical protein QYE76_039313 [Lolium multiflorum]|uniref:Uncharacterized protein n=1 Tax=Lolium multiflorum TaxID=4521 RepID=A0AAD8WS16_LOLMU|nr:hypothetical protein QYE76_039313 [Lolium multiflorum]
MLMGDFNLIRGAQDKNNNNINWALVNLFNDAIARWALLEVLKSWWEELLASNVNPRDAIGVWHGHDSGLRQVLKGWSANLGKERRVTKAEILAQIQNLDMIADEQGLDEEGWALRYHLEDQLIQIFSDEEEYWRQRGRLRWTLQGDANTKYFHAVANGRRRRCHISSLKTDEGEITDQQAITQHVYDFYRALMGAEEPKLLSLQQDFLATEVRVTD